MVGVKQRLGYVVVLTLFLLVGCKTDMTVEIFSSRHRRSG